MEMVQTRITIQALVWIFWAKPQEIYAMMASLGAEM